MARAKTAPTKPPAVLLFKLEDWPLSRHLFALLPPPGAYASAPCYYYSKKHRGHAARLEALPERPVAATDERAMFALIDAALAPYFESGEADGSLEGEGTHGFHADIDVATARSALQEGGFRLLEVPELLASLTRPEAEGETLRKVVRLQKALVKARLLPARELASLVSYLASGGAPPDVDVEAGRLLGTLVIHGAIERWNAVHERALALVLRVKAWPSLAPPPDGPEEAGLDRFGMLAERLYAAGFGPRDLARAAYLGATDDDLASEHHHVLGLLSRVDDEAIVIAGAGGAIDAERAYRALLVALLEQIDDSLQPSVRARVVRFLGGPGGEGVPGRIYAELASADARVFGKILAARARALIKAGDATALGELQTASRALVPDLWKKIAPRARAVLASARPASPSVPAPRRTTAAELLREAYGFDFPDEIHAVWDLAQELSPTRGCDAFWGDDSLGVGLVGPFDVLSGKYGRKRPKLPMALHWRYTMDLPELFTVAHGDSDGLHFGYWFDQELGESGWIASYYANDAYELSVPGRTLFEALRDELESRFAGALDGVEDEPDELAAHAKNLTALTRLREKLMTYGTGDRPEIGVTYTQIHDLRGLRRRLAVAPSREGMGVVAPHASFSPIDGAPAALKAARRRRALVEQVIEGAAAGLGGTALWLGRELWAQGHDAEAYATLDAAYAALGRPGHRAVLAAHAENRRLPNVSLL